MKLEAKIFRVNKDKLKAFATISMDDCFSVTGIKIIEGINGLFISMPNQKNSKGEYKDICFPYTKEFRQELSDVILNKYYESEVDESYVREEREAIQNEDNFDDYGDDFLPF